MTEPKKWFTILVTVEGKENMLRVNKMLDVWNGKHTRLDGSQIVKYLDTTDTKNVEILKMRREYK
jgi:hypothetical protein